MNLYAVVLILTGWLLATTRFSRRPFHFKPLARTLGASMITVGIAALI